MAENKLSTRQTGLSGENKAALFLENSGYVIVARNFRVRTGEIDIIALGKTKREGDTIVFVEVKSLPHGSLELLEHELNSIKQQKIIKTAKCYLQKYRQYSDCYIRFDVLAIDVPGLESVHHIVNAFSE